MYELKNCPFCGGYAEKDTLKERSYSPLCAFLTTPIMYMCDVKYVVLRVVSILLLKMQ